MMSDSKEKSVDGYIKNLAILTYKSCTCNTVLISKHLLSVAVPEDLDVLCIPYTLLHSLRSPENIPANDHVYLLAETCKICSLLAGCITATYNCNSLLPVEETVACSAC